jgi:DnaJ-class molecular chaperone
MNAVHPIFAPLLAVVCPPPTIVCPKCGGEGWIEGTGYDASLGYDVTRQYPCSKCLGDGHITEEA